MLPESLLRIRLYSVHWGHSCKSVNNTEKVLVLMELILFTQKFYINLFIIVFMFKKIGSRGNSQ